MAGPAGRSRAGEGPAALGLLRPGPWAGGGEAGLPGRPRSAVSVFLLSPHLACASVFISILFTSFVLILAGSSQAFCDPGCAWPGRSVLQIWGKGCEDQV